MDPEIGSLGRCLFIVDDVTTKEDTEIGVQRTTKVFFKKNYFFQCYFMHSNQKKSPVSNEKK